MLLCTICGVIELRNGVIAFEVFTFNLRQYTGWGGALPLRDRAAKAIEALVHAKSCTVPVNNDTDV